MHVFVHKLKNRQPEGSESRQGQQGGEMLKKYLQKGVHRNIRITLKSKQAQQNDTVQYIKTNLA